MKIAYVVSLSPIQRWKWVSSKKWFSRSFLISTILQFSTGWGNINYKNQNIKWIYQQVYFHIRLFRLSRNFSERKFCRFKQKIEYKILVRRNFSGFCKLIIKHIISKRGILLAILNFSELESLANNAKIGSSLKFLLIRVLHFPRGLGPEEVLSPACMWETERRLKETILNRKQQNFKTYVIASMV